jgi:hypothetical protein
VTQCWAYAARLPEDGSLIWPRRPHGATPGWGYRLLPDLHAEAYWVIQRLCSLGPYDSRRLDWGAIAIRVDAAALREVLRLIGPAGGPEMAAYSALADGMAPNEQIALVACEL